MFAKLCALTLAGTAKQTVTGAEYTAAVVTSYDGQFGQRLKLFGTVPAEAGLIELKDVEPGCERQLKVTVMSVPLAVIGQMGVGDGAGGAVSSF